MQEQTLKLYKSRWNKYLEWLGDRPVNSETVQGFVDYLLEKGRSAATVNGFLRTARQFVPGGITIPNTVKQDETHNRKLSSEEFDKFQQSLDILKPDQKEDILRVIRDEMPKRQYAALYYLVQKVGFISLGKEVKLSQIRGLGA